MNGRVVRGAVAKKISFRMRRPQDPPLRSLEWSPHVLKQEVQRLLILNDVSPLDLMRGWDQSNDGSFSKKEFCVMMKKVVADDELWDEQLRDVVHETFTVVSGGDKVLDVIEVSVCVR